MSTAPEVSVCRECHHSHDHCHDVLVVHVDEWAECADPACEAVIERHLLWAACVDLDPSCPCG